MYLVYEMYDMLNIVTGNEKYPAAVLIRVISLGNLVSKWSFQVELDKQGKLTKFLKIDRSFNEKNREKKQDFGYRTNV
ncbi:MAG: DNA-3-methyladenine glycosylase [Patescibacteria group bacterium]